MNLEKTEIEADCGNGAASRAPLRAVAAPARFVPGPVGRVKSVDNGAGILVVDDAPANLQVLAGMLKDRGYKARPVPSGKLALLAARRDPPDLILLDINMPEMNGYEVCEHLKADDNLKRIPVIFISALTEQLDKVKAFATGGVDYITKPFQMEELHARVETHLKLRRLQIELEEYSRHLELARERLQRDLELAR
jgi:DNA-binding response OmpR family regulator